MKGKTHIVGGVLFSSIFILYLFPLVYWLSFEEGNMLSYLIYFSSAAIGSLLPDIDAAGSYLGRNIKFLSVPFSRLFGHRKFGHSFVFLALIIVVMLFFQVHVAFIMGICMGFISHLFLDAMTISGVYMFWPILKIKIRFLKVKTGSDFEKKVVVALKFFLIFILFEVIFGLNEIIGIIMSLFNLLKIYFTQN